MRVIAGEHGGRTLKTPAGKRTRPTQGQVRRVLFDILGEAVVDARVLDLFAGVGAIGIEALSRGAREAVFVERSTRAQRCLRANLEALGLGARARLLAMDVITGIRILESEGVPFSWIFADPPYGASPVDWITRAARGGPDRLLASGGTLVLEESRRSPAPESLAGLRRRRSRDVGETSIAFYGWEGL